MNKLLKKILKATKKKHDEPVKTVETSEHFHERWKSWGCDLDDSECEPNDNGSVRQKYFYDGNRVSCYPAMSPCREQKWGHLGLVVSVEYVKHIATVKFDDRCHGCNKQCSVLEMTYNEMVHSA